MQNGNRKFHEFAIKSSLFKGRSDWYFCYLKSEKIAHVLALLADNAPANKGDFMLELSHSAAILPHTVVHFVSGQLSQAELLADLFSLFTSVRIAGTSGAITLDNMRIILEEYENIAEKFGSSQPSPFVSADDLSVPILGDYVPLALPPIAREVFQKDNKGHGKGHYETENVPKDVLKEQSKEQGERTSKVLEFVRTKKTGVSIKEISAVVKGVSTKTIQRELSALVSKGLIKKDGERRWSLYFPTHFDDPASN